MKTAKRIYRLLLALYPPHYRNGFGKQMMQTFIDQYRDVASTEGQVRMDFWRFLITDELQNIVRQHLIALGESYPFLRLTTTKVMLSALLFLPLYVTFYTILVTVVLTMPHPQVNGVWFLLALAMLLLLPAVCSMLVSYVLASMLINRLPKRKMSRS